MSRTDTERLDWLSQRQGACYLHDTCTRILWDQRGTAFRSGVEGPTLRDAIDAAMNADNAPTPEQLVVSPESSVATK